MSLNTKYSEIVVESFMPANTAGLHGSVHIRPVAGQRYSRNLFVECSKKLSEDFPVGTRFRIRAKLTNRNGGRRFLYSYHGWPFEVVKKGA